MCTFDHTVTVSAKGLQNGVIQTLAYHHPAEQDESFKFSLRNFSRELGFRGQPKIRQNRFSSESTPTNMKTIRPFLISALFLSTLGNSEAQVVYKDLSPDLVLQMPQESYNNIELDIDGDQVGDVKFQYTNYPSFSLWNLGIVQVDTINNKFETMYDNSMSPSPIGDYYVKQLSANDEVSSAASFSSDYPQVGDIYNANFNGQSGKYIGFRMKSGSDFKYGWMAVELSGSGDMTFTIKEYAYQNTVNTPIDAGQTSGVGIEHRGLAAGGFDVYPNPIQHFLAITHQDLQKVDQLRLYSIHGALLHQWQNPVLPLKVETADWEKGIYLVEIVTGGHLYNQLLIKN